MTKDEFIDGYCERSGITRDFFFAHGYAAPCDCGEDKCEGWSYESHSLIRDPGVAFPDTGHPEPTFRISETAAIEAGSLYVYAGGNRQIVCFKPDGTIEMGEGYTPTDAAEAFIDVLRHMLPSKVENDRLQERAKEAESALEILTTCPGEGSCGCRACLNTGHLKNWEMGKKP